MVFFGVETNVNDSLRRGIDEFNANLRDSNVAGVLYADESFIKIFDTDDKKHYVVVYLKPVIPYQFFIYMTIFTGLIGFIFNITLLKYVFGFMALIGVAYKYLIILLFKKGLRKQGYEGIIRVL